MNRREVLTKGGALLVGAAFGGELAKKAEAAATSFQDGKYQTFPRLHVGLNGQEVPVFQDIDLGTLGPDVDTIFGLDFLGDIPTKSPAIYQPTGQVLETRVVGIKRTDLETVQFKNVLGGDRFDVYKISDHGGDPALDQMARLHAQNTARAHQKVIYIGDLGLFQQQWGGGERVLLNTIIKAQRPGKPDLGIQEPDFVNQRTY